MSRSSLTQLGICTLLVSACAVEPTAPLDFHTIPMDLEIPAVTKGAPTPGTRARVSLAVLTGDESGKVFPCSRSRAVIGRVGSDVPLDDDEVSRRHALLEIHEDRYILKDLDSTNGTFVDERRISEIEISDRGEFRVGSTQIMLIITPTTEEI